MPASWVLVSIGATCWKNSKPQKYCQFSTQRSTVSSCGRFVDVLEVMQIHYEAGRLGRSTDRSIKAAKGLRLMWEQVLNLSRHQCEGCVRFFLQRDD